MTREYCHKLSWHEGKKVSFLTHIKERIASCKNWRSHAQFDTFQLFHFPLSSLREMCACCLSLCPLACLVTWTQLTSPLPCLRLKLSTYPVEEAFLKITWLLHFLTGNLSTKALVEEKFQSWKLGKSDISTSVPAASLPKLSISPLGESFPFDNSTVSQVDHWKS